MSGSFIQSSARAAVGVFVDDKLRTVAYPYFLWSTVYFFSVLLFEQHSKDVLGFSDLWRIVYQPLVHFWFLYALFVFMLLFGLAFKLGVSPLWFLVLAIGFRCSEFFGLEMGDMSLADNIRRYLPFFALGAYINRGEPIISLSKSPMPLLVGFVLVGYTTSWFAVMAGWREDPILILGAIMPGAVAMLSLAIILERLGWLRFLAYIGQHSLEVYLAHVWGYTLVRIVLFNVLGVENLVVHILLGLAGGVCFALAVSYFAQRFGLKYLFSLRGFSLSYRRVV
jgi:peptidoglycan/LPS O-acetylase OafA/YrhL